MSPLISTRLFKGDVRTQKTANQMEQNKNLSMSFFQTSLNEIRAIELPYYLIAAIVNTNALRNHSVRSL